MNRLVWLEPSSRPSQYFEVACPEFITPGDELFIATVFTSMNIHDWTTRLAWGGNWKLKMRKVASVGWWNISCVFYGKHYLLSWIFREKNKDISRTRNHKIQKTEETCTFSVVTQAKWTISSAIHVWWVLWLRFDLTCNTVPFLKVKFYLFTGT